MIRAYASGDFGACRDLFIEVFNAPPWNNQWTEATAAVRLRDFIDQKRFLGFTLWEGEVLLGAAICRVTSYYTGDQIYVEELFVRPDCQRGGHGTALMRALEVYAREHGIVGITLLTGREYPSFGFFRKCGYERLDYLAFMFKRVEEGQ